MEELTIERKGADFLVKAESCTRQRLLDEGFCVWGTQQFDSINGIYFEVTHPLMVEKAVTPFKDTILRKKPPLTRW
jgi:hypothetical protein